MGSPRFFGQMNGDLCVHVPLFLRQIVLPHKKYSGRERSRMRVVRCRRRLIVALRLPQWEEHERVRGGWSCIYRYRIYDYSTLLATTTSEEEECSTTKTKELRASLFETTTPTEGTTNSRETVLRRVTVLRMKKGKSEDFQRALVPMNQRKIQRNNSDDGFWLRCVDASAV